MDHAIALDRVTLRRLLELRLGDLRADLQRASPPPEDHDASEVNDQKDSATQAQFAAVRNAEERRDIDEIVSVEAALHRLENGSYGICMQCGEPIAAQRLLAQPAALRCAACQSEVEHQRAARR